MPHMMRALFRFGVIEVFEKCMHPRLLKCRKMKEQQPRTSKSTRPVRYTVSMARVVVESCMRDISTLQIDEYPSKVTDLQDNCTGDHTMATTATRDLYPPIEPNSTGMLKVSDIHTIYYEESGNPKGNPVVFVHGGPGAGTSPDDRRFFDPQAYRIILFDQRGAGKSTPTAEVKENTTWDLVADMEKLRKHLGVDKWVVFGGSWGSTLSLAYAETHPDQVKALILRGIFTLRRRELEWFYQDGGASLMFPDYWEKYESVIPEEERKDMFSAFYRRLTGDNEEEVAKAARAWSAWEMATSRLYVDNTLIQKASNDVWALQFARIECHYFVNRGWFKQDDQLLQNAGCLRKIPGTIVQGRYDMVCPAETAWLLHKKWPEAEFHIVPDAGHSKMEPGTMKLLLDAADKYKNL